MQNKLVKCGKLSISNSKPFILIAGPCQLENEKHALDVAFELKKITEKLGFNLKSSLKEAISSLYDALENKLLDDPLNNPKYYNIKTMQKINLK